MKNIKYLLLPVVMTAALYYYSCDDSGITTSLPPGRVYVTVTNLKTLDRNVEGVYQLWIIFLDSAGNPYSRNAGTFNVNQNGDPVDTGGNVLVFSLGADSSNVSRVVRCFITVGADNADPSDPRLLAGPFIDMGDSMTANLTLGDTNAVGDVIGILGSYSGHFMLNQPTDSNLNCASGIWFTNISGVDQLPLGTLNASSQWTYEGWAVDTVNFRYYSTGKFRDPTIEDYDGAGPCAGILGHYNKPGQDWAQLAGGCPGVLNLRNGHFQALITLEPIGENGQALAKPFFLWLLKHYGINAGCGVVDNVVNYQNYLGINPYRAHVQILK